MKNEEIKKDIVYGNVSVTDDEMKLKDAKIRVTMMVDLETVKGFKSLAEKMGSKYQTLMNQKLREILEVEQSKENLLERVSKLEQRVFRGKRHKKAV